MSQQTPWSHLSHQLVCGLKHHPHQPGLGWMRMRAGSIYTHSWALLSGTLGSIVSSRGDCHRHHLHHHHHCHKQLGFIAGSSRCSLTASSLVCMAGVLVSARQCTRESRGVATGITSITTAVVYSSVRVSALEKAGGLPQASPPSPSPSTRHQTSPSEMPSIAL